MLSVPSVAVFLTLSAAAQVKISIGISPEVTVSGEIVKLGDIAEISGGGISAKLKSISFGYAPNFAATRELGRAQIRLAIEAAGFSEKDYVLNAPEKILIRRAGQEVGLLQIREAIEKTVLSRFESEKAEVRIAEFDAPEKTLVPVGAIEIRTNLTGIPNYFQKFSVPVEIRVDGKTVRRFAANLRIEAFSEVLVAVKALSAGSRITDADVSLEKRRLEKPLASYLRQTSALRGLTMVKNLAGGEAVTLDTVVSGVVVKNGDAVRIEAKSANLKIIVAGEARASGKIGDRIAVKNLQSGVILQAIVVDEGLVRINF